LTPYPDVELQVAVQSDNSPPGPAQPIATVQVGFPVPFFDRNQGGIYQAQANLLRAGEEGHRVRTDLTARLAQAFERYENNRTLLQMYAKDILPNQVQAFRAVVARHSLGGGKDKDAVSYNDLVTAEQSLVNVVTNYINTLRDQWSAVVDVAGLLQTSDLFQLSEQGERLSVPDLEQLLPLCCVHPCSTVDDRWLRGADGAWPTPTSTPALKMIELPPPTPAPSPPKRRDLEVVPMPEVRAPAATTTAPVIEVEAPLPPPRLGTPHTR